MGVIAAHVLIAILVLHQIAGASAGASFRMSSDIARYRLVVITPGTPYRNFGVPYPPLALVIFKLLGPEMLGAFARRLIIFNVCCHATIVWTLHRVWGRRAAWSYLVLSVPLMINPNSPTMVTVDVAYRISTHADYPVANALCLLSLALAAIGAVFYLRHAVAKAEAA